MAKKRQSIRDIQEALGTNTKYIRASQESEEQDIQTENKEENVACEVDPCAFVVTPENAENIRLLAEYQHTTPEALINMAIEDLLALRYRQLQAAKEGSASNTKD